MKAIKFSSSGDSVLLKILCMKRPISYKNQENRALDTVNMDPALVLSEYTLMLCVCDTGAGIDPQNQSKVFTEFAQFNRNDLQSGGGSGLGLWISKSIGKYICIAI